MKKRGKSSAGSKLCAAAYIIPIIASSVIDPPEEVFAFRERVEFCQGKEGCSDNTKE